MAEDHPDEPLFEPISVKVLEAVRLSGLSRSRLYELMRAGDIEYSKVGSSTLVLVESLRRFIYDRRCDREGYQAQQAKNPTLEGLDCSYSRLVTPDGQGN